MTVSVLDQRVAVLEMSGPAPEVRVAINEPGLPVAPSCNIVMVREGTAVWTNAVDVLDGSGGAPATALDTPVSVSAPGSDPRVVRTTVTGLENVDELVFAPSGTVSVTGQRVRIVINLCRDQDLRHGAGRT